MQALDVLQRRIGSVRELESVVKTMKALSGATIRQYELSVVALADYYRGVELGLHAALKGYQVPTLPRLSAGSPLGVIVLGSDQGLCGQFNELVVERGHRDLSEHPERKPRILAVGARAGELLRQRGHPLEDLLPVAGSVSTVAGTVEQILLVIDAWQAGDILHEGIREVVLYHNKTSARSAYRARRIHLLPVDLRRFRHLEVRPWPSNKVPMFTMTRKSLLSALLRQYFFVVLFRACAESLASEHAARLTAMQRASKNIDEHLQALNAEYQQRRQATVTEELLDVFAGYQTLSGV